MLTGANGKLRLALMLALLISLVIELMTLYALITAQLYEDGSMQYLGITGLGYCVIPAWGCAPR